MSITQNFTSRSKLRVWFGITIAGKFFGLVSGVIAKPLIATAVIGLLAAVGGAGYVGVHLLREHVSGDRRHSSLEKSDTNTPDSVQRSVNFGVFAAFNPDGSRIVTKSRYGSVRVWDAATYKEISVLQDSQGELTSAAFSPLEDGARPEEHEHVNNQSRRFSHS